MCSLPRPVTWGDERQHVRKFSMNTTATPPISGKPGSRLWTGRTTRPSALAGPGTDLAADAGEVPGVVGVGDRHHGPRVGSPTGKAESGTEEEFSWAMESHKATGFPEIKWFFRKVDKLEMPSDPAQLAGAVEQWTKVLAFRKRMQDINNPVFYAGSSIRVRGICPVFEHDLSQWLARNPARPVRPRNWRPTVPPRVAQLSVAFPPSSTQNAPGCSAQAVRQAQL